MKKNRGRLLLVCIAVFVAVPLTFCTAIAGGVQLITSNSTPVENINSADVKRIFLGKKKSWPDGSPIEFVILKSGAAHDAFLKLYVKKSSVQFKTYWKKQVFTGKGSSPKSFDTEGELVAYVAGKKGTIGYVSSGTAIAGTKLLSEK